jgi:site-specific DNA-methyltransferase (adenine-specific)
VKPYYQDESVTLYHGDCRDVLPTIESVDAMVTDPPFGIAWSRATWDDDPEQYAELIAWLVAESQRMVTGWNFVFQAMPQCGRFHAWFPEGWRLFAACKNFAHIRPTDVWHSWDPVVFWNNGAKRGARADGLANRDYFVGNVAGVFGERIDHPSPKPLDTMKHIVGLATPAGGTLVEPFAGSGTTLRAAKDLGLRAIGVELEERYCEIAARRLSQGALTEMFH